MTTSRSSAVSSARPVPKRPSQKVLPQREVAYTFVGVLVTLAASAILILEIVGAILEPPGGFCWIAKQLAFAGIVLGLVYGNLVYQLTRIGHLRRVQRHAAERPPSRARFYSDHAPRLTVLVPSYKEEVPVVRQAVLSSALQRYRKKRVVLLIDDPPGPASEGDRRALDAVRAVPGDVQRRLDRHADRIEYAVSSFRQRTVLDPDLAFESRELARVHDEVAAWYRAMAAEHAEIDHTDRLFKQVTYLEPATFHSNRAKTLRSDTPLPVEEIEQDYRFLESLFRVELTSFERKRFANLSHEPNKAMNLNSYIGLIGRTHSVKPTRDGLPLLEVEADAVDLVIPETDYLITLDADSILDPDYAARMVAIMELPGNERIAVSQTPYSAVPDPERLIERVAGATTDIQYNVHQGFTSYDGTYWVGANALLRMTALREICQTHRVGAHEIRRYISDRTVIEDTESSVDLLTQGWRLYNLPERLSFSATPSDFGALLIQRRRWANGGLIILPKLIRYLYLRRNPFEKLSEGFFRVHYLVSPAVVNLGLLVLMVGPFEKNLHSIWLPLTALPYFFFYARDMMQIGYRFLDPLRVYALNLMLIPVNLAGVFQSVRQIFTGRTIAFMRTPKVIDRRTSAPSRHVWAIWLFTVWAYLNATLDLAAGRHLHGAFATMNGTFLFYAAVRFLRDTPRTRRRGSASRRSVLWPLWKNEPLGEATAMSGNVPHAPAD